MKDCYKATRQHVNLFSRQLVINKTGLCFRCQMLAAVDVLSMTQIQQPGKEKLLILKTKNP